MRPRLLLLPFLLLLCWQTSSAQEYQHIIFENVAVFDGQSQALLPSRHVRITGNKITEIRETPFSDTENARIIKGEGKTLMPGLIDVHVHLVFGALRMEELRTQGLTQESIMKKAAANANAMLLRGFTSVRDVGGPIFPLKAAIDAGTIQGPRIWPSGAFISQTGGHGDFRSPEERSRRFFGKPSLAELYNATFIADGRAEVLTAVRENLRFGASQIKIMAGGGASSAYDPLDVTQYTLDEMKAAVEAADDWGTYVTVHAYTPKAVQRAVEAGVKCIEHGQLLDEKTLKLLAKKKIWLSLQNLVEDSPDMDPKRLEKRQPIIEGQAKIWPLAKKYNVKLAWGTDFLFEPELNKRQNEFILKLQKWFTNAEILKMVTYDNAQLLQMSGLRSPWPGKLGVVETGAFADLILVDGNPLENLELIAQSEESFLMIMKDGKIVLEK